MNARRMVAAFTLAALPALPLLGHGAQVTNQAAHWAYFWGMSGTEALAFAAVGAATCLPIGGFGAAVCFGLGGA